MSIGLWDLVHKSNFFSMCFNDRRKMVLSFASGKTIHIKMKKRKAFLENSPAAKKYIKRQIKSLDLCINGKVGIKDAGATAVLCGILTACFSSIGFRTSIDPVYDSRAFHFHFSCITNVRLGKLYYHSSGLEWRSCSSR